LAEFVSRAGHPYAAGRNTDKGPGEATAVSKLSPYLRYRLVTEHDVVAAVLERHGLGPAEKFVQEVLWRTYWKGWLEMRPSVWTRFVEERDRQRQTFPNKRALATAESGSTGIEGFDDWARELVKTGYLHNHARMWFASIWIFTLRLPWTLGADFFLRHLVDADTASNTLSWRWVAGLQTVGKTYLATADNIARYTDGRFSPTGLATEAFEITEQPVARPHPLPGLSNPSSSERSLLLVTPDDLNPESIIRADVPIKAAIVATSAAWLWGDGAWVFVDEAAKETASRVATSFHCEADVSVDPDAATLAAAARSAGVRQILTAYAPVGPVADALARLTPDLATEGVTLVQVRREWDDLFWPHATKGFFKFKERMPDLLREQCLQ
jgi:deoxyribodipyrimidine photo-lyase